MKKARKLLRIIFGRTAFVVMSLLLQISILLAGFRFLSHYMVYILRRLYAAQRICNPLCHK